MVIAMRAYEHDGHTGMRRGREVAMSRAAAPAVIAILLMLAAAPRARALAPAAPGDLDTARVVDVDTLSTPFLPRLGGDLLRQASSPLRLDGRDLVGIGIAAGITGGLILLDGELDDRARVLRDGNAWVADASPIVTELGGTYGIAGAALFAGYSYLFDDARGKQTSQMLAEAYITSGIWAQVGKYAGGRERPSAAFEHPHSHGGIWYGPFERFTNPGHLSSASFSSFPSGHTTTAFALATVFAEQYDGTLTVPIIAYTAASLVGISRMTEHAHWSSDVFVGALLGYLCGHDVVSHHRASYAPGHADLVEPAGPTYRFSAGMADGIATIGFSYTY